MRHSERLVYQRGIKMHRLVAASAVMLLVVAACGAPQEYDVIIRHGLIYDGSGRRRTWRRRRSRTIASPRSAPRRGRRQSEIDAAGLAVAPGFINMLSWATDSLIEDGRGRATSGRASRSRSSAKAGRSARSTTTMKA